MIRIAIIADDLTGALDTASPFACNGARTFCFTEPDAINIQTAAGADVISVSTNSRNMPPDRACAAVKAAAESIRSLSPETVLKKIDSRLKGNVAVECGAVASVFGLSHLLVVPAAPDVGRHVINGAVQGAGVSHPIPLSPMFAKSTCQIRIPDVASHVDMQNVVRLFMNERGMLPVCSRGFAVALAEYLYPGGVAEKPSLKGPWLVAIGSRDPLTSAQRTALCNASGFICNEAPDGKAESIPPSWQELLLHCTGMQTEDPELVARRFAEGVKTAIEAGEPGTMLCSGGDTARAVLHTLRQNCLLVLGEAAPGLPVSRICVGGRDLIFISKSGGFGKPSTLLDLFSNQPGHGPKATNTDGSQHRQPQH